MVSLASKTKVIITALMILPFASSSVLASACNTALSNQATKSGLPESLTTALASTLAIGPGGKMYPFAIQHGGKTFIEDTPEKALRLFRELKAKGGKKFRVGCLGVEITSGHDEKYVWNALNPMWNVANSMSGIHANVKTDIGAPLAAITNNETPPPMDIPSSTPPTGLDFIEPSTHSEITIDKNVGNERSTTAVGAVKSTWGLFNNKKPSPLTSP